MVAGEPSVPEHTKDDREQGAKQHLARRADRGADQDQHRQRDRKIVGIALLQAKRAGLEPQPILKEPGAKDGGRAAERNHERRRGDGLRTGKINPCLRQRVLPKPCVHILL